MDLKEQYYSLMSKEPMKLYIGIVQLTDVFCSFFYIFKCFYQVPEYVFGILIRIQKVIKYGSKTLVMTEC